MTQSDQDNDLVFMKRALALAWKQQGKTGTNPAVGCIIVQDGAIVGEGATADGGRPHGEAVALANAQSSVSGATAYVTLEPCAHESVRGPRCCDLLAAAGIRRLVCSLPDPDPRTAGRGFAYLKSRGLAVEIGLLSDDVHHQLQEFIDRFGTI